MKYAGFSALLLLLFLSPAFKTSTPPGLPLDSSIYFEENLGQFAAPIRYQATLGDRQVRWMDDGVSIALVREVAQPRSSLNQTPQMDDRFPESVARKTRLEPKAFESLVWGLHFAGSQPSQPQGREARSGLINYLRGDDPAAWVTGVQRYQELWYQDLYPGIDLRYYGLPDGVLKYDFVVAPQADPMTIRLQVTGSESLSILPNGDLLIHTTWGDITEDAPICYQLVDGYRAPVDMAYVLHDDSTYGFVFMGHYDPARALIIDPVTLNWATFLHSSTSDDYVMAGVRDASNALYMVGYTQTATFPVTSGVFQDVYAGGIDNWVAKLNATGSSLSYLTFLGGSSWELPYGIGITSGGDAIITGFCNSTNYPVTAGSVQATHPGGLVKGFVTRLNATGTGLVYSTYLGGSDRDYPYDIAVDASGAAYVTGYTLSVNFPRSPGAFQTLPTSSGDVFVVKIQPDGSSLAYATLFGGNGHDIGNGIRVNAAGEAFVVGSTGSTNLPFGSEAYQATPNFVPGLTAEDGFLCRLSADGSLLLAGTYLGGSASDVTRAVDLGPSGDVYVTGVTYSTNFPTTSGAFRTTPYPNSSYGDVFVTRLTPDAGSLVYSTYLGGSNVDFSESIRVNGNEEAHILGSTMSTDFYTTGGSNGYVAMYDIFLTILDPQGNAAPYSLLFGGSYNDYPRASGALYVDNNKIALSVTTHSPDAPATTGTYQSVKTNGINDAPWLLSMEVNTVLAPGVADFAARWDEEAGAAHLSWSSLDPTAVMAWQIERQGPDGIWMPVSQLAGDAPTAYLDHTATPGRWTYRIAAVGGDGSLAWSPSLGVTVPVLGTVGSLVEVYPNPARDRIRVRYFQQPDEYVRLVLRDARGREVLTLLGLPPLSQAAWRLQQVILPPLDRGVYFLSVYRSQTPVAVRKVIVQ